MNIRDRLAASLSFAWPALESFHRRKGAVRAIEDVPYVEGGSSKQRLDLWLPAAASSGPSPIVVFVHGGYWRAQDRRFVRWLFGLHSNVGVALADRGLVAAIVGYRQTPEVTRADDSLADIARAVRWAVDHAREHGGDPARLLLVGHSAGAHLATLLAVEPRYLAAAGVAPGAVRGVVALAGVHDVARLAATLPERQARVVRRLFGDSDAALSRSSPERLWGPTAPPALFVVGTREVPSILREHEAMKAVLGGAAEFVELPGRTHMDLVIQMGRSRGDLVTDRIVDFVERVTGPAGSRELEMASGGS